MADLLSKFLDFLANWWNSGDLAIQVVLLGHYKAVIMGVTAVLTAVIAIILFSFYREALSGDKWILCFGGAFVVFTFQYAAQTITFWLNRTFPLADPSYWELLGALGHCIGSPVNTILFFAAARFLMDKSPVVPWWLYPVAVIAFAFSVVPLLFDVETSFLTRLPDAVFAAVTLTILAWALFFNIDPHWYRRKRPSDNQDGNWWDRRRPWRNLVLALIVLLSVLLYALVNLGYALNPVLAERSTGFQGLENLEGYSIGPLEGYDTMIFAIAILLKLSLFLAAFYLIMRNLLFLSPQVMSRMLRRVRSGTLVYHSSQGIVRTIGNSLGADAVQLYFKLPGHFNRKRAVAWWCWQMESGGAMAKDRVRTPLPAESTIAGKILRRGELIKRKRRDASSPSWDLPAENGKKIEDPGIQSAVAVPILYHGSVIGGLSIGWKGAYTMTATAIQRVGFMADMLGPVVESRRALSALYFLGHWFQRQEIVAPHQGEEEALRRLTRVILPTLSPAAIGIAVEVGFRAFFAYGKEGTGKGRLAVQWVPNGGSKERCEQKMSEWAALREGKGGNERHVEGLRIEGAEVGTLMLLPRGPGGRQAPPSVINDWLLRQTVAIQLADAIFDATRVWLWSTLNRLQTTLSKGGSSSIATWFEALKTAADEAGTSWIVAELGKGRRPNEEGSAPELVHYGDDAALDVVRGLPQLSEGRAVGSSIHHFRLTKRRHGARHVLRLAFKSEGALFIGVPRKEFGAELQKDWPWRIFLEHLVDAAEAGLTRLQIGVFHEDELHRHGMMTASVITGSLMHQLSNMAADLGSDLFGLSRATKKHPVEPPIEERIDSMTQVVGDLTQVTSAIRDVTNLDQSRPCQISEAIRRTERLFGPRLAKKNIGLAVDVPVDLEVNVPTYVLALAVANLISNSLFAIASSETVAGRIQIVAEDHGGIIRCRVCDNGPGVDPKLRNRIFDLNVSTKPGSNGLGLYLARRTLQENGGDLLLTESKPGHTEFTMILPKG